MKKTLKDPKWLGGNELKYLKEVLENDKTKQTFTERLETSFKNLYGLRYAIAMNSGTSCIHAALVAMGIRPGDEVIVPAYTVVMDSSIPHFMGAKPVYADIDYYTHNIDPEDVERKITSKTRAIIAVSYHGLPYDIDRIKDVANGSRIHILEDNAQTQLATYKGRSIGKDATMSLWSFERTKHMSTFEGGILCTDSESLAREARKFAGLGFKNLTADKSKMVAITPKDFQRPDFTRHDRIGLNYRYNEFCAAVACAQLERLASAVQRRQSIAALYDRVFEGTDWEPQTVPPGYVSSYFTYAVKSPYRYTNDWITFYNKVLEAGGDDFYGMMAPAYKEPAMAYLGYHTRCPVTEEVQRRSMLFKTNYRTIEEAQKYIGILYEVVHECR